MSNPTQAHRWIETATFHADVEDLESRWQRRIIGTSEVPLIDMGNGDPVIFVPPLEQLEFVYARQLQTLSQTRRVLLYRRRELRTREIGHEERVAELRILLDGLAVDQADLVGYGEAAIVLLQFALRYPQRCRSLTLIAQGATYRPAPYPLVYLLQELYLRLPIEYVLPSGILRQMTLNALTAHAWDNRAIPALPRHLIEEQINKIYQWPLVFKYSVLPLLYRFDVRRQIETLQTPTLLINRADDPLAPETETRWLAERLPHCANYHIVPGREHFFLYSQAEIITPLIETFLLTRNGVEGPLKPQQLY